MKTILACLCALLVGCDVARIELQSIDIDHYPDNERNSNLAEALVHYNREYLSFKIPALTNEMWLGIGLGHSLAQEGQKAAIRLTYDRNNKAVLDNLTTLRSQFSTVLPQLAAIHASKESLITQLDQIGDSWLQRLYVESPEDVLDDVAEVFRSTISVEDFTNVLESMERDVGRPSNFSFLWAEYYEAHLQYPEMIQIVYEAESSSENRVPAALAWEQEESEWLISGMSFSRQ